MQATIDSKKKGDYAFRQKDFSMAIDCYSQVAFDLLILVFFFRWVINPETLYKEDLIWCSPSSATTITMSLDHISFFWSTVALNCLYLITNFNCCAVH